MCIFENLMARLILLTFYMPFLYPLKEILELCEFIYLNGVEDEDSEDQRSMMLFGDLFKV